MPTILDYYEYAKLAAAAYIGMEKAPATDGPNVAFQADDQERLPGALANKTFNVDAPESKASGEPVWNIPVNKNGESGYFGNDDTGFAATLFEKDGDLALVIRGTEPAGDQLTSDLLQADLAGIGLLGMALAQATSMVYLILRACVPLAARRRKMKAVSGAITQALRGRSWAHPMPVYPKHCRTGVIEPAAGGSNGHRPGRLGAPAGRPAGWTTEDRVYPMASASPGDLTT